MPAFPSPTLTAEEAADIEAGDLLTAPWQIELRGVLMDSADCDTGLVIAEFLDGFGVPDTRNADVSRPMRHGMFASPQYLDGRPMTCAVAALGDTYADLLANQILLGGAWAPVVDTDEDLVIPLAFTLGDADTQYLVFGKPQRAKFGYKKLAQIRSTFNKPFTDAAVCEFLATDPRIYDRTLLSSTATLSSTSGGHGFPLGFPHGFGTATSGSVNCVNSGNIATDPYIIIRAGALGASAINVSNTTTTMEWAINLSLAAGEFLTIDMGNQAVMLNGNSDRAALVTRPPSTWWTLEPGDNQILLAATGDGTTAEIQWRNAYLL